MPTVLATDVRYVAALTIGVIACGFDVHTRRIPNSITFAGALLGMAFAFFSAGTGSLTMSVLGWLTGLALFLPFFLLGGMGAGDVKLLACLGAWLSPTQTLWMALYAAMAGGVMAIVVALANGYLRQAVTNVSALLMHWRVMGITPLPALTLSEARGPRLPYALPIVVGALVAIWPQLI